MENRGMSIVTADEFTPRRSRGDDEDHNPWEAYEIHDNCFLCGKRLTVPFVYWHGDYHKDGPTSICLHPECVGKLCRGLLADLEVMKAQGFALPEQSP